MNGTEQIETKLVKIVFPYFYVHKDHKSHPPAGITGKPSWSVGISFRVTNAAPGWDELTINARTILNRTDNIIISELVTESTFQCTAGLTFKSKHFVLAHLINQTMGQVQGAWYAKQSNYFVKNMLPQAFDAHKNIELDFKKEIFEKWV